MNLSIMCIIILIIYNFFSFNAFAHIYGAKMSVNNDTDDGFILGLLATGANISKKYPLQFPIIKDGGSTITTADVFLEPHSKKTFYVSNLVGHPNSKILYSISIRTNKILEVTPTDFFNRDCDHRDSESFYQKNEQYFKSLTPQEIKEIYIDDCITRKKYKTNRIVIFSSSFNIVANEMNDDKGNKYSYSYAFFKEKYPPLLNFEYSSKEMPFYYRAEAGPDFYSAANSDITKVALSDLKLTLRYVCGLRRDQIHEGMKIAPFCY